MSSKRKNSVYFIPPYFDNSVNASSESYDRQYFYLKCCQSKRKNQTPTAVTIPQRTEVALCAVTISLLLITEHRSLSLRYSRHPAIPVAKQSRTTYQRAQLWKPPGAEPREKPLEAGTWWKYWQSYAHSNCSAFQRKGEGAAVALLFMFANTFPLRLVFHARPGIINWSGSRVSHN